MSAGRTERIYQRREVVHFDREPVPAARLRAPSVRHHLRAASSISWTTRLAEHESEIAPAEHREDRRRSHDFLKSEMLGVKRDGGIDVVDDVSDLDSRHG